MVDNTIFTNTIATELKYLPNMKEISYYKVYRNMNVIHQVRVSNHGTYLRTWLAKDYDPFVSANISIAFTSNGVPTNDCILNKETNEPFNDCTPCLSQQMQNQISCRPRQVKGISNKKRSFKVTQFVYNCQNLDLKDAEILIKAIRQAASTGVYNDPFRNNPIKAAKRTVLTPMETESKRQDKSILREKNNVIKLTESDLYSLIKEAVERTLRNFLK